MMTFSMIPAAAQNEADLVAESLSGDRDAFGRIVSRYQSLVCSLAYSATGSVSQSEDLTQDTFVIAWKQLRDLREPEKLRAASKFFSQNLFFRISRVIYNHSLLMMLLLWVIPVSLQSHIIAWARRRREQFLSTLKSI